MAQSFFGCASVVPPSLQNFAAGLPRLALLGVRAAAPPIAPLIWFAMLTPPAAGRRPPADKPLIDQWYRYASGSRFRVDTNLTFTNCGTIPPDAPRR